VAAVLASLLVVWVTFVPCFLFAFLGTPYVERLRPNLHLTAALTGITSAVVGVIASPALFFAAHTLTAALWVCAELGLLAGPVLAVALNDALRVLKSGGNSRCGLCTIRLGRRRDVAARIGGLCRRRSVIDGGPAPSAKVPELRSQLDHAAQNARSSASSDIAMIIDRA
jgi:hypothetical protein